MRLPHVHEHAAVVEGGRESADGDRGLGGRRGHAPLLGRLVARRRRVGPGARRSQRHLPPPRAQRVEDEQPAEQRLAQPGDELDRLGRHERADLSAQRAEHAGLVARLHGRGVGRLGEDVAQPRPGHAAGRGRPEHRDLRVEPEHRAPHERQAQARARVVDEVAGGEVVGAVDDEVVPAQHAVDRLVRQPHAVRDDLDRGVQRRQGVARRVDLGPPHVGDAVDDLPLQVRGVDDVVVHDPDRPDARRGEVLQDRRAEPAGTDDADARRTQPALAVDADPRQQQVARRARELLGRERRSGCDQRGQT